MLRREILRATSNVLAALEESGVTSLFKSIVDSRLEKPSKEKILPVFSHYIKLYDQFGYTERQILVILGLEPLHDTTFWTKILTFDDIRQPFFFSLNGSLRFTQEHLPKILKLIERKKRSKMMNLDNSQ